MFRLLWRFLKPYRLQVALVLVFVFVQAMAELALPTLMSDIVNTGIMKGDVAYIWRVGGRMLLVALVGTACAVAAAFFAARAAMGFGRLLRGEIFQHVERFSLHEFDKIGTPSLITRNTNDVTQLQMAVMIGLRMMAMAPIMAVGGLIMALSKDKDLAWILAVVLPVLLVMVFFVSRRAFPLFTSIQKKIDRINRIIRENLEGIRVIRAFNRLEHERRRFHEANYDLTATSIAVNRLMALMMPSTMLVMNAAIIAIIWFGAVRLDRGTLQIGNMMAFFQYAMQIMISFVMATMMFIMVPRAQASAERILEVLAVEPEIQDPPAPVTESREDRKGWVEFQNVTFRYHGAEEPALKDVSFTARPGEVTAIIGGTGAGKSTLVHLILRFYDVDEGEILVDGVDVRHLPQEVLRAKIGFVPQKAYLFSGTLADNIRYGKEDATEEEIRHAAELAQAMEFIAEMEGGLNAPIAQGGTNVSGGQRQRLAIARALVRKPEIYIFDDSFSALDFKTEARLRVALRRETAGATVIVVAQRVSSIMDADQIVVLDEGRVVGIGTHRELMRTCPVYREIVLSQLPEEESA